MYYEICIHSTVHTHMVTIICDHDVFLCILGTLYNLNFISHTYIITWRFVRLYNIHNYILCIIYTYSVKLYTF